jgi:hypothetical protein
MTDLLINFVDFVGVLVLFSVIIKLVALMLGSRTGKINFLPIPLHLKLVTNHRVCNSAI